MSRSNNYYERMSELADKSVAQVFAITENNISHFQKNDMGARLFSYGFAILIITILIRLMQWALSYAGSLGFLRVGSGPDDLFFLGLLGVAVLMMAGGLVANTFLIWNVQAQNREVARVVAGKFESIIAMEGQDDLLKARQPADGAAQQPSGSS